jgi:hypothetical protein
MRGIVRRTRSDSIAIFPVSRSIICAADSSLAFTHCGLTTATLASVVAALHTLRRVKSIGLISSWSSGFCVRIAHCYDSQAFCTKAHLEWLRSCRITLATWPAQNTPPLRRGDPVVVGIHIVLGAFFFGAFQSAKAWIVGASPAMAGLRNA